MKYVKIKQIFELILSKDITVEISKSSTNSYVENFNCRLYQKSTASLRNILEVHQGLLSMDDLCFSKSVTYRYYLQNRNAISTYCLA